MTITVRTTGTDLAIEGTGWHIDDDGHLHIRGRSGNVATVHRDHWTSVGQA